MDNQHAEMTAKSHHQERPVTESETQHQSQWSRDASRDYQHHQVTSSKESSSRDNHNKSSKESLNNQESQHQELLKELNTSQHQHQSSETHVSLLSQDQDALHHHHHVAVKSHLLKQKTNK